MPSSYTLAPVSWQLETWLSPVGTWQQEKKTGIIVNPYKRRYSSGLDHLHVLIEFETGAIASISNETSPC